MKYDIDAKYDFMIKFVSEVVDDTDQLVIQEMFRDCLYRGYKFQIEVSGLKFPPYNNCFYLSNVQ